METRLSASVLGLLATGIDAALTRNEEWHFAWAPPFELTFVRLLFLLARYLGLLIHIADLAFSSIMTARFSATEQPSEYFCTSMLAFQSVSSQSMLLVLHFILMLRVVALYNRSIGALLLILLIGRFAGVTASVLHGLIKYPTILNFSGPCLNELAPGTHPIINPFLLFIYGEFLTQIILHGMVWKRIIWDPDFRVLSSPRPALVSVLNRDGLTISMGMIVAMVAMTVSAVKKGMGVVFVFPLWITFLSISGTRIILNFQKLRPSEALASSKISQHTELTTITDASISGSPWDATTFLDRELYFQVIGPKYGQLEGPRRSSF
ncbi:hypothetical protein GYMLUDRAFT_38135 [Collybiopsis luxurians FD-317 M1]|nr:hypothetical protein GYMLUDRAFT_38135 [Collybiopsis luxurians FD-317 M1]